MTNTSSFIATVAASVTEASLVSSMEKLFEAEKITKKLLGELSRTLLAHAIQHKDCRLVNKLATSPNLTKTHRDACQLYFKAMMPFSTEKVGEEKHALTSFKEFSVKKFNSKSDCGSEALEAWLGDESSNIWTWYSSNVQMEKKPIDFTKKIGNDVKKAIEAGMTSSEIMKAVIEAGVNASDVAAIILGDSEPAQQAVNA